MKRPARIGVTHWLASRPHNATHLTVQETMKDSVCRGYVDNKKRFTLPPRHSKKRFIAVTCRSADEGTLLFYERCGYRVAAKDPVWLRAVGWDLLTMFFKPLKSNTSNKGLDRVDAEAILS